MNNDEAFRLGVKVVISRITASECKKTMWGIVPSWIGLETLCAWAGNMVDEGTIEELAYISRERILCQYYYEGELREKLLEHGLVHVHKDENIYVISDLIAEVTTQGETLDKAYENLAEALQLYYE